MPVSNPVGVTRLGHVNIVVPDHNTAVCHWRRLFDTEFFLFMYVPEVTAVNTLGVIGDTCIELFAPWSAESMLGRTLARRGPGLFAIEFTVESYDRAEQAIREHGLRITQADPQRYLWVHPADLGGISVEFSPALFNGDPRDEPGWPAGRWAKGPLGITGLRSLSLNVTEPAATVAGRFGELFGARAVADGSAGGRDFVEVEIAGDTFRLLSPPGGGNTRGGVASIDFLVADLDDVHRWARSAGVPVVVTGEGRLALPEQLNLGSRVEFVQGREENTQ
jgi:methylmalonyl-CoA/ethylmalonyl-CoA epimerase